MVKDISEKRKKEDSLWSSFFRDIGFVQYFKIDILLLVFKVVH
jgi:hypothetical protein